MISFVRASLRSPSTENRPYAAVSGGIFVVLSHVPFAYCQKSPTGAVRSMPSVSNPYVPYMGFGGAGGGAGSGTACVSVGGGDGSGTVDGCGCDAPQAVARERTIHARCFTRAVVARETARSRRRTARARRRARSATRHRARRI